MRQTALSGSLLPGLSPHLHLVLMVLLAYPAHTQAAIDPEPQESLIGRWISSRYISPDDEQEWHTAFFVASIEKPQLLTRHSGLLVRCTRAPLNRRLVVTFAFGAVLRTQIDGAIEVNLKLDQAGTRREILVTRNQANAEFQGDSGQHFLAEIMRSRHVTATARMHPKGTAKVSLPLQDAHAKFSQLLQRCNLTLSNAGPRVASPSIPTKPDRTVPSAGKELAKRNAFSAHHTINNTVFRYHIKLPENPTHTPPPLYILLHGGVRRPSWPEGSRWWSDYGLHNELADGIVLSPSAWRGAYWWSSEQRKNISALVASLRNTHPFDPDRVYVIGVSDGGAGAMYLAMHHDFAIQGVVSLIGHPGVLYNPRINRNGAPEIETLADTRLLLINGAEDPLFPPDTLDKWLQRLQSANAPLQSYIQPGMQHELNLDNSARALIRDFLKKPPDNMHSKAK